MVTQPVSQLGQTFYTAPFTVPMPLPSGGTFWLSASPTGLAAAVVDDAVVVRAGNAIVFQHDYGAAGPPTPALVAVPASQLAPWAGQTLTVAFEDRHGGVIGASPAGEWTLALDPATAARVRDGGVRDLFLVIGYQGTTPEWPDA